MPLGASVWMTTLVFATIGAALPVGDGDGGGGDGLFRLRLLHTNDMHARFEQVSQATGKCSEAEAEANKCYGGFSRVHTILNEEIANAGKENVSVLSLNAGDTYQGTVWYSLFKWKVVLHFLKMLKIDAMSLGNHEFDDGVEGLAPFLREVGTPVLAANLNFSQEPEMLKTPVRSHLVLDRGGRKIGVVGYLTPETTILARTGKVRFEDEIASLKREGEILRKKGVDIIIALGHSGYDVDLRIAKDVTDVDVVVGGHSHTFLYTGTAPDSDVPANVYPIMVTQSSGRKVAVVQAYAFTKYLGKLDLTFDARGELVTATGNPILLDHKIAEDATVLAEVKKWKEKLNETLMQPIGKAKVYLDGSQCRFYECNLGNLVTDTYIYHAVKNHSGPYWTDVGIAIQQAGGIRASIDAAPNGGTVTREDLITCLPFFSSLSVVKIKGRYLLAALEWSVARYDPNHKLGRGEFLQVSGLKVKYDLRKASGSRVVSLAARCASCRLPIFRPLALDSDYNVIMPTFLLRGGDNFTMFKEHGQELYQFDLPETEIAINYVVEKGLIYNGLEGRIEILEDEAKYSIGFILKPHFTHGFVFIFLLLLK